MTASVPLYLMPGAKDTSILQLDDTEGLVRLFLEHIVQRPSTMPVYSPDSKVSIDSATILSHRISIRTVYMAQQSRPSSPSKDVERASSTRSRDIIKAHPSSPRLGKRVLQYDCKSREARVVRAIGMSQPEPLRCNLLTFPDLPDSRTDSTIVELPGRSKEVALFVDANTQQYVSNDPDHNKESNLLVAKIHLDRLGARAWQISGLRQVYVQNVSSLLTGSA